MAKNESARAKTISALFAQIDYIYKLMLQAGWPANVFSTYCLAQIMLESDWMTSNVANTDNNYTGIKYVGQQQATKGIKAPDGGNYAHYANFGAFLADYKRVLMLNTGGKGRPWDAASAQQFLDRLRANTYFTDPNYYTKYNAALRRVNEALHWGNEQAKKFVQQYNQGKTDFTYTPGQGLTSNAEFDMGRWWTTTANWARNNPIQAGLSAVAVLLAVGIVKKAVS